MSAHVIRQRGRGTDRNADCCVNTVDEKITTATNLVNFGPITTETLWLICIGAESTYAKIRSMLDFKGHSLGGSSMASLLVRNAQSCLRMPGGLHVGLCPAF